MKRTILLMTAVASAILLAATATLLDPPGPAEAAFPGKTGKIVFQSSRSGNSDIYSMNSNGFKG